MITTRSGVPLKIVRGSKKSITGRKPFLVEYVITTESMLKFILTGTNPDSLGKRFSMTRHEFLYDSEDELYEALGLKKD